MLGRLGLKRSVSNGVLSKLIFELAAVEKERRRDMIKNCKVVWTTSIFVLLAAEFGRNTEIGNEVEIEM
jgi:hypothetical protein